MTERILVTGGAGFIGSHLAASLLQDGYEVDVADNLSTGSRDNVPEGAAFHEVDLHLADSLTLLPDQPYAAICHLAGQSSGEKSFDDPLYDLEANAKSTLLLTEWALNRGIPAFLYASSMGVYGQPDQQPVDESIQPRPVSYYGSSKYFAEQILRVASSRGLRTCAFRMFNVYGPGQNMANMKQGMVSIFLSMLLKGEPLLVKGSLQRVRDLVYIDDVVHAWKMALAQSAEGIFNVGSGVGTTVESLIAALSQACGIDQTHAVTEGTGTPGDQFAMTANVRRITDTLGWQPTVSLEQGLANMVSWARGDG